MPEAWENAGNRHTIYFSFESDWLKRWREFSGPVTWRSKAKTKQSRIAFNTRLKIAQCQGHLFKVGAELIVQTILNVGEERVQFFQVGRAFSPIWAKRTGKSRITSIFISLLSRKMFNFVGVCVLWFLWRKTGQTWAHWWTCEGRRNKWISWWRSCWCRG